MPSGVWAASREGRHLPQKIPALPFRAYHQLFVKVGCKKKNLHAHCAIQVVYLGANHLITGFLQNSCQRKFHFLNNTLIFWGICAQTRRDLNPQSPNQCNLYILYIYIFNRKFDHKVTKYMRTFSKKRNKWTFSLRPLAFIGLPWNFILGIVWHSYVV